jgi:AraC-like DNA-binding protein
MVRGEALAFFGELVAECGGDSAALLRAAHIDPAILTHRHALLPYRQMIGLLERAAETLECPDFGMRLAKRQSPVGVLGPLDIAMRNAATLGDAFRYCATNVHTYSSATAIYLDSEPAEDRWMLRFDILLSRTPQQRQVAEHALLVTYLAIQMMSGSRARAREIWFTHEPASRPAVYRSYFGAPVCFGQPFNAIILGARDEALPVVGRNEQIYELATNFIDAQFPKTDAPLSAKVRMILKRRLAKGGGFYEDVAGELGMHPRTLQRRLRAEGARFDAIKDEIRREAASTYLGQTRIPVTRVAGLLGYSELSALSRSCQRWFSRSPRQFRDEAVAATSRA